MRRKLSGALLALALAACGQVGPDTGAGSSSEALVAAPAPAKVAASAEEATPADARGQFFLGLKKHDKGDYARATELFLKSAETFPVARALAARSMMEDGRLADAYRNAVQATRDAPADATTWFMLGLVASRDERPDEAKEAYLKCLDLDPTNAGAHNNLGGLFYHREDFYRARVETEDALRLSDDDFSRSIAEANLGELDALAEHLGLAEEHYDRALELAPESAHAYFALATLYDVTGRPEASRKMAELGVSLDPTGATRRAISFVWPELELHQAALIAEARGDTATARKLWTSLLGQDVGQPGSTGLRWKPLAGRAADHLADLVHKSWTIPTGDGADTGLVASPTISGIDQSALLNGISPTIETQTNVEATVEVYQGYTEFQRTLPKPPHKCD